MTTKNNNSNQCQWDDYRRRRLAIQRQAVRRVKYTLLAVALLSGCWFLFLLWKDARHPQTEPSRLETIAPSPTESALPIVPQSPEKTDQSQPLTKTTISHPVVSDTDKAKVACYSKWQKITLPKEEQDHDT